MRSLWHWRSRAEAPILYSFGPYLELLCFRDLARVSPCSLMAHAPIVSASRARVQWADNAIVWEVLQDSAASPWRDCWSEMDESEACKAK